MLPEEVFLVKWVLRSVLKYVSCLNCSLAFVRYYFLEMPQREPVDRILLCWHKGSAFSFWRPYSEGTGAEPVSTLPVWVVLSGGSIGKLSYSVFDAPWEGIAQSYLQSYRGGNPDQVLLNCKKDEHRIAASAEDFHIQCCKINSGRWGNTDQVLTVRDGGFGVIVAKWQSGKEAFTF